MTQSFILIITCLFLTSSLCLTFPLTTPDGVSFSGELWENNDHWGFSAYSSAIFQSMIYGTCHPKVFAQFRIQYGKFVHITVQGLGTALETAQANNQSQSLIDWLTYEKDRWTAMNTTFVEDYTLNPAYVIGGARIDSLISAVSPYYANTTSATAIPVVLAPSIILPSWLSEMLPKVNDSNVYKDFLTSLKTPEAVTKVNAILDELNAAGNLSQPEAQTIFSSIVEKEYYFWGWFQPQNAETKECIIPAPPQAPSTDKETGLIVGCSILGASTLFLLIAYRRKVVRTANYQNIR